MKRWQTILTQVIATGAQALNLWANFIPDNIKIFIALGLGTAQLIGANMAHNSNPDGTPAAQPYKELPK